MKRIKIFISSVQSEFAEERAMLCYYIRTDALLGKFFEPFIFEEVPANEFPVSHVYLKEVELCDIYLGLYGNLYGFEDEEGISPTEHEYDLAATLHKSRLIFIKSIDEERRHPKEIALIRKIERDVVRKTFVDVDGLRTSVYAALVRYLEEKEYIAALVRYLEEKEYIRWRPFDASFDNGASLEDLDDPKVVQGRSKAIQSDPREVADLMELIGSNPSISRAELSRRLALSERQVRKMIDKLRIEGRLIRKGGKTGEWVIVKA